MLSFSFLSEHRRGVLLALVCVFSVCFLSAQESESESPELNPRTGFPEIVEKPFIMFNEGVSFAQITRVELIDDSREYCSNEDGRVMTMPLATVRPIGFFYNSAILIGAVFTTVVNQDILDGGGRVDPVGQVVGKAVGDNDVLDPVRVTALHQHRQLVLLCQLL